MVIVGGNWEGKQQLVFVTNTRFVWCCFRSFIYSKSVPPLTLRLTFELFVILTYPQPPPLAEWSAVLAPINVIRLHIPFIDQFPLTLCIYYSGELPMGRVYWPGLNAIMPQYIFATLTSYRVCESSLYLSKVIILSIIGAVMIQNSSGSQELSLLLQSNIVLDRSGILNTEKRRRKYERTVFDNEILPLALSAVRSEKRSNNSMTKKNWRPI